MKNKFFATMLVTFLLAGSTAIPGFAEAAKDTFVVLNIDRPNMMVNGVEKKIDSENEVTPVLISDTTFVPIRAIIEALGGKVEWNEDEQKVTVYLNDKQVELWLDKNNVIANGTEMYTKVAPTSINGRTMLPLRFVSESLGLCVNWEDSTQSISISSSSDYVAIVGGTEVKRSEYNIYLSRAKSDITNFFSQNQITGTPEGGIWNLLINGIKAGEVAKKRALDYSIQHEVLLSKGKENNLTLSEDEVKSIDDNMSKMIQQEGGITALEKKMMEYNNVNLSEYTDFIKENELLNKYLQGIYKQVKISDDEVAKFYENNKSNFDKVTVKHILLLTSDQGKELSLEKQEEVKKKAEDILVKVKAGEDFASLAKQYSEDPGSKDNGGEYTFGRGEMVKEFEDWSFQAKAGDVDIVKTSYGYHVMKFVGASTLEDAKATIRNSLVNQAVSTYVKQLVDSPAFNTIKNQSVYDSIEVK